MWKRYDKRPKIRWRIVSLSLTSWITVNQWARTHLDEVSVACRCILDDRMVTRENVDYPAPNRLNRVSRASTSNHSHRFTCYSPAWNRLKGSAMRKIFPDRYSILPMPELLSDQPWRNHQPKVLYAFDRRTKTYIDPYLCPLNVKTKKFFLHKTTVEITKAKAEETTQQWIVPKRVRRPVEFDLIRWLLCCLLISFGRIPYKHLTAVNVGMFADRPWTYTEQQTLA